MLTVYEFMDMCVEPYFLNVRIWDSDKEGFVFVGTLDDMPEELQEETVTSFGLPYKADEITINIH